MPNRPLTAFYPRSQPWMTRQSYSHELVNALTYPVALALVEGGVIGVLAQKAFSVGPFLFATIMAAPMFANLTSFMWAHLSRGRRKVRFINTLQLAMLAVTAGIALLPTDGVGPLLLGVLVIAARCLLVGVVTIRSMVWRMNYPRHVRAQITGRLALINTLIIAGAPLISYTLLDLHVNAFRLVYPASVLVALIGVVAFSRVRLRGERDLLRYEKTPAARPQPHGLPAPIYEYTPDRPTGERHNFWTVLRRDRFYRWYMTWQFVAGVSGMTGEVVVVAMIADMTAGLRVGGFGVEYLTSIAMTTTIPMVLATLTLPYWARMLDRMHVAEFRGRQGWLWIANQAMNWAGAMLGSLPVLVVARLFQGVARGAGMLAWNLGHNDFADRKMVSVYMGIHVTLTGIRGAIAPFVGMALYAGWDGWLFGDTGLGLPSFAGIGAQVFLITTVLAVVAEMGFKALYRSIQAEQGPAVPAD